jgi:glycerophosphoryl diester phosphodiesterase
MLCVMAVLLTHASVAMAANPFLRGQYTRKRPLNIAHRGASSVAPENTLEAALRAFEGGADMWELDVHLSRDRELIVIHDESLRRTTNAASVFPDDSRKRDAYLVRDFDLVELRRLEAGAWFARERGGREDVPEADYAWYAGGNVKLPTLREALSITKTLGFTVNVEIKNSPSYYEGIEKRTVDLIRELAMTDAVLISSFDHEVIVRVKALAPEIAAAPLSSQRVGNPGVYIAEVLEADAYHPSARALGTSSEAYSRKPVAENLQKAHVDNCRQHGVTVNVWTINDDRPGGLIEQLISIGATGIITDVPQRLEPLLDRQFGPDKERTGVGMRSAFSEVSALAR